VAALLGEAVGLPRGNTRKKCTLTPFFSEGGSSILEVMGSECFIDKDCGVLCDRRAAVSLGVAVGFLLGRTRKKMYSDPIFQRARNVL
jgi:hypothetical protein